MTTSAKSISAPTARPTARGPLGPYADAGTSFDGSGAGPVPKLGGIVATVEAEPAPAAAACNSTLSPGRAAVKYSTRHVFRSAAAIEPETPASAQLELAR